MIKPNLANIIILTLLTWFTFSGQAEALVVTRGPYLQLGTSTSIIVRWRTDVATDTVVHYGNAPGNLTNVVTIPGSTNEHEVTINGLLADTNYFYSVGNSSGVLEGDDSGYFFTTSPQPGTPKATRLWIIGDSGLADNNSRAVRDAFKTYNNGNPPDLWLMLGDNAYNDGTDSQYQNAVFNQYPEILQQSVLWPALGNHDAFSSFAVEQSGPYFQAFNIPTNAEAGGAVSGTEVYYSFDYGNIHFICLDSYQSSRLPEGQMLTWLESDLLANDKPWVFAFWHNPPYTKGSHDSDREGPEIDMRGRVLPILENYGVDVVFAGHSHSYERSFLLDSHYGDSSTLQNSMIVDSGDGQVDGAGAYTKSAGGGANQGTVYVVSGNGSRTSTRGNLNHPAMFASIRSLGSMVVDVDGNRMDAIMLDSASQEADHFTIIKSQDNTSPSVVKMTATDATVVSVQFSEPVDQTTAGSVANYSLGQGINITNASVLGRIVTLTTSPLSANVSYTLTVNNVEDLAGNTIGSNNQVQFDYITAVPEIVITAPADESSFNSGESITFTGTSNDLEDGNISANIVWTSNLDGSIGTGSSVSAILSVGTHTIKASITDTDGKSAENQIIVIILAGGQQVNTIELQVSAGTDDAEESATGNVVVGSADLDMVRSDGHQTVGIRFNGLTIPQGATIVNAYIQFTADESQPQFTMLTLEAEAVNDSATYSRNVNLDISSRARTTAAVSWICDPWKTAGDSGIDQRSANISPIIREVIGRSGWVSGNALSVIITGIGLRSARSFEGNQAQAPVLHIEYADTGGTSNTAPTVSIASPVSGASFVLGDTITFTGTGADVEDGDVTASLTWDSNLDGAIGNSGFFSTTLSEGTHRITVTATDSGNMTGSNAMTVTVLPPGGGTTTISIPINLGSDDAEQKPAGNVIIGSLDLDLVASGGDQTIGMRFNNVTIPQGTTIVDAYIQFTAANPSSTVTSLTLEGEATDNAITFVNNINGHVSTRPRTTASIPWSPVAWATVGAAGVDQRTPNLSSIVQEIVNRSNWTSNNSLAFIVTGSGKREADAFEANASAAPVLHVEFTNANGNQPPTASILAPANGSSFTVGDSITFTGNGTDPEDGNVTASLIWESNLDGLIGTGGSFSTTALSEGTHSMTVTATDNGNLTGLDTITVTVLTAGGGATTLSIPINSGSDDAEENPTGNVKIGSLDLDFVASGGDQTIGMRFNNVSIPQGATIVDSYIQFTVSTARPTVTSLTVAGEAVDNANTFVNNINSNISTRSTTTASVPWSPVAWTTVGEAGVDQRTPNLSTIIEEIVNRSNWVTNNSLALVITGTGKREAHSFEGSQVDAPVLHVVFQ
ncbi:MAG: metallophosphoesterase [Methylococcales bacterium]